MLSPEIQGVLYPAFVDALTTGDLVLRLTAVDSLSTMIEYLAFSRDVFEPFIAPIMSSLFQLIRDASEVETLGRLLKAILSIVENTEEKVRT